MTGIRLIHTIAAATAERHGGFLVQHYYGILVALLFFFVYVSKVLIVLLTLVIKVKIQTGGSESEE